MADVFISFRHVNPDQQLAAELAKYLTQHGVTYFIDYEIRISMNWSEVIERELKAAKSLVVLLSEDSMRSDMVRLEVKLAAKFKKQIFPVRLGYEGAFPYDLAAYLDLIEWRLWKPNEPFAPICAAILDGLAESPTKNGLEPSAEALRRLNEVTELRGAPLPSADPRLETGALQLNSPFYVRRIHDEKVEGLVQQNGETVLIKGPRQVGKTSLAARARAAATRNGQKSCYIDFQLLDESRLEDSSTLLKYIAARMAKEFATAIQPKDVWDDMLGDADSLTDFIERAVLPSSTKPLLFCLDEVDNIFKHDYRDNFFGLVRGWHNRRATHPEWNRFNLLISHSTEPGLFIRDLNQSPFNVGTPFRLGDFNRDEILWLNQNHNRPMKGAEDVERLIRLIGGHPYLIRQALYAMATSNITITHLEQIAPDDTGPFGDHLRRLFWILRDNDRVLKALTRVIQLGECDSEDDFQRLRAAGVIAGDTRQAARPRCQLYKLYMEKHL